PYLVPPFRTLLMNSHGDFFTGSVGAVALHVRRCWFDRGTRKFHSIRALLFRYRRYVENRCHAGWQGVEGFTLLAFSAALRWRGYPHRRWFHDWHGREPLDVAVPEGDAHSSGSMRYLQRGREWSAAAFERAVLASDARWVVWAQDAVPELPAE